MRRFTRYCTLILLAYGVILPGPISAQNGTESAVHGRRTDHALRRVRAGGAAIRRVGLRAAFRCLL